MIGQLNFRTMRRATLAMAVLMSPSAMAVEDTSGELARNLRALENLTALGEQIKALVTPEFGFTDDTIRHWTSAVDAAFAPQLLEADFLAALDDRLSDEVRNAALAFYRSPIGQESYELVAASHPLTEGSAIAHGKAYVETASAEENALFVDLFEAQSGPARANHAVDIYFRAMEIAAEPIIGKAGAEQWVASVQGLRAGYVENYFSVTVGIYSNLQGDKLAELVEALGTPDMLAYGKLSTAALDEAMHAAVDRLETAYAEEL